jgi:integrase/recombinase XerD
MRQYIEPFLKYLSERKGYAQNTLAAYRNDLNQLIAYMETEQQKGIIGSTAELVNSYLLNLREKKYSPATSARKIASTRSFFKFMVQSGKLRENPTQKLLSPQVRKHLPGFLSTSQYQQLLAEPLKLTTPEAKRDVVMLELLYSTGLRISELVSLDVKDIDLTQDYVSSLYGNSKRRVPLDDHMSKLLKKFIENDRLELLYDEKEEALFLNRRGKRLTRQGFWQIIKNYASKADLSAKVTPHTLRHSFAMRKLQTGADLHSVQELLGHSYIASTRIYQKSVPREK